MGKGGEAKDGEKMLRRSWASHHGRVSRWGLDPIFLFFRFDESGGVLGGQSRVGQGRDENPLFFWSGAKTTSMEDNDCVMAVCVCVDSTYVPLAI